MAERLHIAAAVAHHHRVTKPDGEFVGIQNVAGHRKRRRPHLEDGARSASSSAAMASCSTITP